VNAEHHNRVLQAATKRANALEGKLARIIEPILAEVGVTAARNFKKYATNHLTAAAREADELAVARIGMDAYREMLPSLVLTADAGTHATNSTMIALKPRPEEAEALAATIEDGVAPENLHVTLAYLGGYDGDLDALRRVLQPLADIHAPLEGEVGGVGAFSDSGKGHPMILLPDVPGLVELRVAITEALIVADIEYGRNHGYTPHVTLSYEKGLDAIPTGFGAELHFDAIMIVRGDTETVTLPLLGDRPLTAAASTAQSAQAEATEAAAAALQSAMDAHEKALKMLKEAEKTGDAHKIEAAAAEAERTRDALDRQLQGVKQPATSPVAPVATSAPTPSPPSAKSTPSQVGDQARQNAAQIAQQRIVDALNAELANPTPAPGVIQRIAQMLGVDESVVAETAQQNGLDDNIAEVERRAKLRSVLPYESYRGWSPPAIHEVIDSGKLTDSLRTKTDPVRQAVVKTTMLPTLDQIGLSFDVTNPLIDRVLAQSGSQIAGIADQTQANVQKIIDQSYEKGLSIPDTAKAIRVGMAEASPARATLIARTELAGATNGASLAVTQIAQDATGTKYRKVWQTAPGAEYPRHDTYPDLDHQTIDDLQAPFTVGDSQLMFPGDPDGPPEEVCNCRCVTSFTPIGSGRFTGAMRREFEGELLRLTSAGGRDLSVSANHPILTRRGWVAAGLLKEGDDLICRISGDRLAARPDVDDVPTEAHERFAALKLASPRVERVAKERVNFHGDVPVGEIEVVTTDDLLFLRPETPYEEQLGKLALALAHREMSLASSAATFDGIKEAQPVRLTASSRSNVMTFEDLRDGSSPDSVVLTQRENASPLAVSSQHVGGNTGVATIEREAVSVRVTASDPALLQATPDGHSADARLARDLLAGFPGIVETDPLVNIVRFSFRGHLYNFSSPTGTFEAAEILVANCALFYEDASGNQTEGGDAESGVVTPDQITSTDGGGSGTSAEGGGALPNQGQSLVTNSPQSLTSADMSFGQNGADALAKDGGFSFNLNGQPASTDRYISALPDHERILGPDENAANALAQYHSDKTPIVSANDGAFLGGWKDPADGKVYLDVSTSFPDREAALRFAGGSNQIAIWDAKLNKDIKVPDRYKTSATAAADSGGSSWRDLSYEKIVERMRTMYANVKLRPSRRSLR
jgi:2'-5' RNA ligase